MDLKEETFAPKCTKENMVRYDVQVGSGKKEGSLKQKKKKDFWLETTAASA